MAPIVDSLIGMIASEIDDPRPGSETVVARLTDVLVIHVLRNYIQSLPADHADWLGALRDNEVAAALGLMHRHPERSWTATELAAAVGLSRSAFFSRFRRGVGESPAEYLARWRIHLAARLLREQRLSVAAAARRVGYRTEAAFSNAFLRATGMRPGAYKRTA